MKFSLFDTLSKCVGVRKCSPMNGGAPMTNGLPLLRQSQEEL